MFTIKTKQIVARNGQTIPLPTVGTCCGQISARARIKAVRTIGSPRREMLHGQFYGLVQEYEMDLERL